MLDLRLACAGLACLVLTGVAFPRVSQAGATLRIGVAAVVDAPASPANALAGTLVRRLARADVFEVESLGAIQSEALAGHLADQVRSWSLSHGADAVLAARDGNGAARLELRSGYSGGLLGRWSVGEGEVGLASALRGIEETFDLPNAVLAAADAASAMAETGERVEPSSEEASESSQFDSFLGAVKSDDPISIESEQLDVSSKNGARHLVFRDRVRVVQGDITLRTRQLDAYYPSGASQPDRLVATGGVRVSQGEREARCERAVYNRLKSLIVCTGNAQLEQGCDVVRGDRIEFDVDAEHFRVSGAASVVLGAEGATCSKAATTGGAGS